MKRELKDDLDDGCHIVTTSVTRHIPMKRELKGGPTGCRVICIGCHKAYPDEKGTESGLVRQVCDIPWKRHKAYPDEKGTERIAGGP